MILSQLFLFNDLSIWILLAPWLFCRRLKPANAVITRKLTIVSSINHCLGQCHCLCHHLNWISQVEMLCCLIILQGTTVSLPKLTLKWLPFELIGKLEAYASFVQKNGIGVTNVLQQYSCMQYRNCC
jgi:hypothetical protein